MAPFSMIKNKLLSQILCVVIYIISFYVAFILTPESIESIWLKILIWHLYATLFIYIGSSLIVAIPTRPAFSERKCTSDLNIYKAKIG